MVCAITSVLPSTGTSFSSSPGVGTPMSPACTLGLFTATQKGQPSVMPRPVFITMRSPTSRSALSNSESQMGCDSAAAAKKNICTRLSRFLRSCASVFMVCAITSKPVGTLKYTVGAISRRLRMVSTMPVGVGLPSSRYSVPPL